MDNWKECTIGDIADITMGQSPESSYYNSNKQGMPFLQGNRTFGFKYPVFDTYTTYVTKEAQKDDVIMSVRAPVGELNIASEKLCLGRGVCSIRMKNGEQMFLYYLLKANQKQLLNKENGTVFGSVNRNDINKLTVKVPTQNIQKKISLILSSLDDKIELNNKINANLEQQAQALFKSWFVDFEPFGGEMPAGWKVGKLSEIAEITMGQSPDGKSYNEDGVGTVFYQGRAEFGSRFPTRRLFTTDPRRMAKKYDILMSVRAPVGDTNIANEDCCIGRGLAAIHSNDNHQSFVYYTVLSLEKQLDIFNGEGTVFGCINKDGLNNLEVVIPSKDDMDKFEKIVASLDADIYNKSEENRRLMTTRDTLLPKLMNGEIEV